MAFDDPKRPDWIMPRTRFPERHRVGERSQMCGLPPSPTPRCCHEPAIRYMILVPRGQRQWRIKLKFSLARGSAGSNGYGFIACRSIGRKHYGMKHNFAALREEGTQVFAKLYNDESAVRHLSDAKRENSSDSYSAEATDEAVESMLGRSIEQSKEVYQMFARPSRKD